MEEAEKLIATQAALQMAVIRALVADGVLPADAILRELKTQRLKSPKLAEAIDDAIQAVRNISH